MLQVCARLEHQSITEFETAKLKRRSLYYIYLIIHAQSSLLREKKEINQNCHQHRRARNVQALDKVCNPFIVLWKKEVTTGYIPANFDFYAETELRSISNN